MPYLETNVPLQEGPSWQAQMDLFIETVSKISARLEHLKAADHQSSGAEGPTTDEPQVGDSASEWVHVSA